MGITIRDGWPEGIGHMGFEVGAQFSSRMELGKSGLHPPPMNGIWYSGSDFAHSIVVNEGYKDDLDFHEYILYTGQGGQDDRKRQVKDQELKTGNLSLFNSYHSGFPVRVVRGFKTEKGPSSGYRYDGLYRVVDAFSESSIDGPIIWRFKMIPLSDKDVSMPDLPESLPDSAPKKAEITVIRRIRNTAEIEKLKKLYDYSCQICNLRINLLGGRGYCEGAHVQPHSDDGPDSRENILILCPNHHSMLDYGILILNIDGTWSTQEETGKIDFKHGHKLSEKFIHFRNKVNQAR